MPAEPPAPRPVRAGGGSDFWDGRVQTEPKNDFCAFIALFLESSAAPTPELPVCVGLKGECVFNAIDYPEKPSPLVDQTASGPQCEKQAGPGIRHSKRAEGGAVAPRGLRNHFE